MYNIRTDVGQSRKGFATHARHLAKGDAMFTIALLLDLRRAIARAMKKSPRQA